jgi:DNA-binding beta-propeller fold protein YncE
MRRTVAAASAALAVPVLLLAFSVPALAGEVHVFESSFGSPGTGDGELSLQVPETNVEPKFPGSGLAVDDATHDVYVADTGNRRVVEFSSAGAFIRAFGAGVGGLGVDTCTGGCVAGTPTAAPGGFEAPTFVAVDNSAGASRGDVYVADTAADLVSKFDPEGNLLSSWGTGGQLNGEHAEHGPFTSISGITVDPAGRLFVYDGNQEQWFEFSQAGAAEPTVAVGRGTVPSGIGVDSLGHLYKVVGYGNLEQYSAAGADLGEIDNPFPAEAATTGFAVDLATNSIFLDQAGAEIEHFGPACASGSTFPCAVDEKFGSAQLSGGGAGVAVDASDGTVYVADAALSRVDAYRVAQSPTVETNSAAAIEQTTATLNGHLDPAGGGEVTECLFEWGTTTAYGDTAPCAEGQSFSAPAAVHSDLTGLQPDTTYHFRLRAANAAVASEGEDETFTTTGPPIVKEEQATDIEPTTATLGATLNPSGYPTEYRFEYGTSASYGSQTPFTPLAAEGHADEAVEAPISSLEKATVYHFRAVARSECEPLANPGHICLTEGPDRTFETLPAVSVRDLTTQTVGPELVVLKAELDPNNGGTTTYELCLGGQAGNYGIGCVEGTLKGVAGEFESIAATFGGLGPNTGYHYRLLASNGNGSTETADAAFTTEPSAVEERAGESCPNTVRREEDNSLSLPDCRAYEQVSPIDKSGYAIGTVPTGGFAPNELSPDGESDAFISHGAFGGVTVSSGFGTSYIARRTAGGWTTEPTMAQVAGPDQQFAGAYGYNADLDRWIIKLSPGLTSESAGENSIPAVVTLYEGGTGGTYHPASPTLEVLGSSGAINALDFSSPLGQSNDFSRLFIGSFDPLLPSDPRPGQSSGGLPDRIYEVDHAGTPGASLSLVAEVPAGLDTAAGCSVDGLVGMRSINWASDDGRSLFYDSPLPLHQGERCDSYLELGNPNPDALFIRFEGGTPVQVSAPLSSQCHAPASCATASPADAFFDGIAPDGSRAWFTTSQPLIDSDADGLEDLYLAELQGGHVTHLTQASAGDATDPTPGEGANVQGVVALSANGSHVAFVATGVLTETPDALGAAAAVGADNLYVYDADTGEIRFVARLCSGPGRSGSTADSACGESLENDGGGDVGLWSLKHNPQPAQFTPDGGFLVFDSYGQLTASDTDEAQDVYRFDADSGALVRVSVGHSGNDGNGNDSRFPAEIATAVGGTQGTAGSFAALPDQAAHDEARAISADGSRIVFSTAAPLVSRDTNAGAEPGCKTLQTGCDIYEWTEEGDDSCHEAEGCVRLISDGITSTGATDPVISASGHDISFLTAGSLVRSDTDGLVDVYDAREGGGFPYSPPPTSCGAAESCHGAAPPSPTGPRITTSGETGGNGTKPKQCAKGKVKVKKHGHTRCVAKKHHKKKSHHHKKKHHKKGHKRHAKSNRGASR